MLPIAKRSTETMLKLIEGLNEGNRSKRINNSQAFMPVTVE
jgi:hypothetical protein